MFRLLCIALMAFVMFSPMAGAQEGRVFIPGVKASDDFRGFVWGVGKEDVKRYEKAVFYQEDAHSLTFLEKPSAYDYRRLVRYVFDNNKLVSASYEFQELIPPSPEPAIDLYEAMKAAITAGKGKPEREEFLWGDRLYAYYPQFWGRAVRSGDLKIKSTWNLGGEAVGELALGFKTPYYTLAYKAQQRAMAKDAFKAPFPSISPVFTNP